MKELSEDKTQKILISAALLMFAALIGYNAFFTPETSNNISHSAVTVKKSKGSEKSHKENSENKININTAGEKELSENLKGIGPALAKRIVSYRETHGGFSAKEELMNIKGISEKIFNKLKNNISIK